MFLILKTFLLFISAPSLMGYKYEFKDKKTVACLGGSDVVKNCFPFIFSTRLSKSYILNAQNYPRCFDPSKSSTFQLIHIRIGQTFHEEFIIGEYAMDTLILPEQGIKFNNFTFILLESGIDFTSYCGIIGLSNKSVEDKGKSNFLQTLIDNNYISVMKIVINKDLLAIDDAPVQGNKLGYADEYTKYKSLFHVNSGGIMIYDLKRKYLYNREKELQICFKIDKRKSYIPLGHLRDFAKEFLNIQDENGNLVCKEFSKIGSSIVSCSKNYQEYYDFSSCFIYIFVNNWSIRIKLSELFELNEDTGRYQFMFEYTDKNRDKLFLGTEILDKYHIEIGKETGVTSFSLYDG